MSAISSRAVIEPDTNAVPENEIWSGATGGYIALASTAVVNCVMAMTYDITTALWYPSY